MTTTHLTRDTPDASRLRARIHALETWEWQDHLAEQARIEWVCSHVTTAEACRTIQRNTPEDKALLRRHGVHF